MMLNKTKQNNKKKQQQSSPNKRDNALMLKPEFKGQPVVAFKVKGTPTVIAAAVTSGVVNQNVTLNQGGLMFNFAARFVTFTEFRITKVKAVVKNFSSNNPGIGLMWFSEDDTTTPTANKALDALTHQFNFSDVVGKHALTYVPHDPAQQTWTLVSSGNPIIGYFKLYSDATNFGTPIVATNLAIVTYDVTIQFRGFI